MAVVCEEEKYAEIYYRFWAKRWNEDVQDTRTIGTLMLVVSVLGWLSEGTARKRYVIAAARDRRRPLLGPQDLLHNM